MAFRVRLGASHLELFQSDGTRALFALRSNRLNAWAYWFYFTQNGALAPDIAYHNVFGFPSDRSDHLALDHP